MSCDQGCTGLRSSKNGRRVKQLNPADDRHGFFHTKEWKWFGRDQGGSQLPENGRYRLSLHEGLPGSGSDCASPGRDSRPLLPPQWNHKSHSSESYVLSEPDQPDHSTRERTLRQFIFLGGRALKKTSSVKSHALTIRTGLRLSRVPVVPQHLLRGRNHVTSAWRGAMVEK